MTKKHRAGWFVLVALLVTRLIGMALIPLNEKTEARYGEMARKMLETGNWVTLMHDYGVPFLAKPPLYAWLSAASMGVFGVNELAARLPSLLLSIGMIALVAYVARQRHGSDGAMTAALVLASSFGFYAAAGTVMTDPALTACVTLILGSFWQALHDQKQPKLWSYLFFVGCGIGLLAKGPVALVLSGLPVFFWVLARKEWLTLWKKLPWITGSALVLAIALPWYLLAEERNPGFLQYFIIGENISRFLDPGWKGDRYGFAHAYPYGMIWLFVLAGLFPWGFSALRHGRGWMKDAAKDRDGWLLFLLLWVFTSPLFFTFAANIIWPYALIMMPGFALLFAELVAQVKKPDVKNIPALAFIPALLGLVAVVALTSFPALADNSSREAVAAWKATAPEEKSRLIFWSDDKEFSAAFYSLGRARSTQDPAAAEALVKDKGNCLITYDKNWSSLPEKAQKALKEVGRYRDKKVRILACVI